MLAMYERSVRSEGGTLVQGLPKSMLCDCSRKLTFVPAGHEYHDWQEPRTLSRVVFFYFDPAEMPGDRDTGATALPPRLFFEGARLA